MEIWPNHGEQLTTGWYIKKSQLCACAYIARNGETELFKYNPLQYDI